MAAVAPPAQPPAQQTPAVQLPGQVPAQNPQRPAQTTSSANPATPTSTPARPGQPATSEKKPDVKTDLPGAGASSSSSASSASAARTDQKDKDKGLKTSSSSADAKTQTSATPSATEVATTVLDVVGQPSVQKQAQYITIFPPDFPVEKWEPKSNKSVGKGYLFFENQLGDNMVLFAVVLGIMAVFMALLLLITGWQSRKEDSYLPVEAKWADGPDRLKKPLPRELRLQPGRSPPRGPPMNRLPPGRPGPSGPARRPPPPQMYAVDRDPAGYPLQQWGGVGYSQPVVRAQPQGYGQAQRGMMQQPQLRRLPSQNQHGW